MGILEIGLTVWAWKRGWGIWALFPMGIGLCLSLLIALVLCDAGVLVIRTPSIIAFIIIDVIAIAILVFMISTPRKNSNLTRSCRSRNSSPTLFSNYQKANDKSRITSEEVDVSPPSARAKLILPNGNDIYIIESIRPIGRVDFEERISSTVSSFVSRHHFWIRSDSGKYFIEDYQSANGTKLNGVDIKGKGLYPLSDGDKIDVAGILILEFKDLLYP